jgi:Pyridoxamine 5'-phosphate oxidase
VARAWPRSVTRPAAGHAPLGRQAGLQPLNRVLQGAEGVDGDPDGIALGEGERPDSPKPPRLPRRHFRREPEDPALLWYEGVMWVAMSAAEREEFLADVHVGVLSAAVGTAGQTLAVPVWYSYQPGGLLTVLTGRRSRKAAAIRAAGRFGLCVQDDSPPYCYVSVEGPLVSEEELDPAERLAMARRYLGAAGGDRYVVGNPDPGREHVAFRMRPEHWLSQDQGKGPAAG